MINFSTIKKSIVTAVNTLFEGDNIQDLIVIENTKKDFEGDLTLVVFSLLKLGFTFKKCIAFKNARFLYFLKHILLYFLKYIHQYETMRFDESKLPDHFC